MLLEVGEKLLFDLGCSQIISSPQVGFFVICLLF